MAEQWSYDPKYSHGYLVPVFALYLLWFRKERIPAEGFRPSWWGLPVLLAGAGLYLLGGYLFVTSIDSFSLLVTLVGLCVVLGGWRALGWAWPAIGFLVFMLPLHHRIEVSFALPLQEFATEASTYTLQTLGFPALSRGNTILVTDMPPIGVAEVCNGLGMLITFCALSTAVAIVIDRPLVDKLVILVSAIPIALISNVARIVVYVFLYRLVGVRPAEFFHDYAGWLMMILALGLLGLELFVLRILFVEPEPEGSVQLDFTGVMKTPGAGSRPAGKTPATRQPEPPPSKLTMEQVPTA
jgi:exosortase